MSADGTDDRTKRGTAIFMWFGTHGWRSRGGEVGEPERERMSGTGGDVTGS